MPLWLYITVLVLGQIGATLVLTGGAFFLSCKLCRLPAATPLRAIQSALVILAFTMAASLVVVLSNSGERRSAPPAAALLLLACIVAPYFLFRWLGRAGWSRAALAWIVFLAICLLPGTGLDVAVRRWLAKAYTISSSSMAPTVQSGDRVLVDPSMTPRRWDVIAFRPPHSPGDVYMSRLVGLPGETVELVDGVVTIDGHSVQRPGSMPAGVYDVNPLGGRPVLGGPGHPFKLGPAEVYVLGDNTKLSLDSRYYPEPLTPTVQRGAVPMDSIIGVARFVYAPRSRWHAFR